MNDALSIAPPLGALVLVVLGGYYFVFLMGRKPNGNDKSLPAQEQATVSSAPKDELPIWERAWKAEGEGRRDETRALILKFVEDSDAAHSARAADLAKAEFWLARDCLSHPSAEEPASKLEEHGGSLELIQIERAIEHLDKARRLAPAERGPVELLAMLRVRHGERDRAISVLKEHLPQSPGLNLMLARIAEESGDQLAQREYAGKARDYFRSLADAQKEDANTRIHLSWAEMLLGNFAEAEALIPGKQSAPTADTTRSALLYRKAQAELAKPEPNTTQAIEFLGQAFRMSPRDATILKSLAQLAARDEKHARQVRDKLEDLLAKGSDSPQLRLHFGSVEAALGRIVEARSHTEKGLALDAKNPSLMNNLAFLLGQAPSPDLDRALKLASNAIELAGTHGSIPPDFWETRGQILASLKKWPEAAGDLERALSRLPGHRGIHVALSKAYEAMDNKGLAEKHRALAAAIPEPKSASEK